MKRVAIMQPYLFPYIGYFQLINLVDDFVIYDDVQYIVRGWINRNNILINNNKNLFTVSLDHSSANKLINEVKIKDDFVKLRKMISISYAKAPYKNEVLNLINEILEYPDNNLARFIGNSLECISVYLGMSTRFLYSSQIPKDNSLKGQYKIMAICKELSATHYVNPIGGVEIYDKEYFDDQGIDLKFIKSDEIDYKQFGGEFVTGLSIIDVMMFNSPDQIKVLLEKFELV